MAALAEDPAAVAVQALLGPGPVALEPWLRGQAAPTPAALAWALKAACYQAWRSEPTRTAACARRAFELQSLCGPDAQIDAIVAWTGAIADLAQGRIEAGQAGLEKAFAGFEGLGDRRHAAETRVPMVMALAMLGRDSEALACAKDALRRLLALGDEAAAGRVELNLGTLLFRLDRHAEAARSYRGAAVRFARTRDAEHSIMADIGLANALTWQFEFDEARRTLSRAVRRAEYRGLKLLQAQARLAAGRIDLLQGRLHRALREMAAACALLEQQGAAPQQSIEAQIALADAYLAVNLLPEAVDLYDKVIGTSAAIGSASDQARALLERARAQARQGDAAAARQGLQQSAALFTDLGNRAAAANVDLAHGALLLQAGQAPAALAQAEAAARALDGSGLLGWQAEAVLLRGQACAALGELVAARAAFDEVLRRAGSLELMPLQLAARTGLGELALATGGAEAAVGAFEQVLDTVDVARRALPEDEFRAGLAATALRAHEGLIRALLDLADCVPARLFEAIERGRASALSLALHAPALPAPPLPGQPEGELSERRCAEAARLAFLRERWKEATRDGDAGGAGRWALSIRELEAELLETHRREVLRRAEKPQPAGAAPWQGCAAQAQQRLGAGEALVLYHLLPGRLVAVVVRSDGMHTLAWTVDGVAERIESLRFQIDAPRFQPALLAAHRERLHERVLKQAQALYRLLWAPLEGALAGCSHVLVVPHGPLHYVPYAALHDGQRWLAERVVTRLMPSTGAWLALAGRRAPVSGPIVALGTAEPGLPQIEHELAAIAATMGPQVMLLRGAAASAAALRLHAAAAAVVHLACHARFRADSPAFSALHLADGPLALHEVRGLGLNAALVVLSACETGLSRIAPGDELIGLVRGFLLGGAGAVLAAQWPVGDDSTGRLMARFYGGLAAGLGAGEALRQAQAEAAAAGEHPFGWAAWALYGEG